MFNYVGLCLWRAWRGLRYAVYAVTVPLFASLGHRTVTSRVERALLQEVWSASSSCPVVSQWSSLRQHSLHTLCRLCAVGHKHETCAGLMLYLSNCPHHTHTATTQKLEILDLFLFFSYAF